MSLAPAPPVPGSSRSQRLVAPLLTGAAAALGSVALHLRDPHVAGSWGFCPVALVGMACPFCGSLRAVHDLTHADLAAAASSNLLLVLAVPVALALWGRRIGTLWRGGADAVPLEVPRAVWLALGVVVAVFTVARNLPSGAWLAP